MRAQDRYDSLIQYYASLHGLDWRRIKRQIEVESGFNPAAVSPRGAKGLMQFMPDTWREQDDADAVPALDDPFNAEENIAAGCRYMRRLYDCFSEIPDEIERYKFALASYNAGRGNINRCLAIAREATGAPASFAEWEKAGRRPGPWQTWEFASRFLPLVTGSRAQETLAYVQRIMGDKKGESA